MAPNKDRHRQGKKASERENDLEKAEIHRQQLEDQRAGEKDTDESKTLAPGK